MFSIYNLCATLNSEKNNSHCIAVFNDKHDLYRGSVYVIYSGKLRVLVSFHESFEPRCKYKRTIL